MKLNRANEKRWEILDGDDTIDAIVLKHAGGQRWRILNEADELLEEHEGEKEDAIDLADMHAAKLLRAKEAQKEQILAAQKDKEAEVDWTFLPGAEKPIVWEEYEKRLGTVRSFLKRAVEWHPPTIAVVFGANPDLGEQAIGDNNLLETLGYRPVKADMVTNNLHEAQRKGKICARNYREHRDGWAVVGSHILMAANKQAVEDRKAREQREGQYAIADIRKSGGREIKGTGFEQEARLYDRELSPA